MLLDMRILLTGATGFIGKNLLIQLFKGGHDLVLLSRNASKTLQNLDVPCEVIECDLTKESPPLSVFTGPIPIDGVIHLAGESIAAGRWTKAQKKKIQDSRTIGTQNLVKAFTLPGARAPKVFASASAIGFYGDRGNEELIESSSPGQGFLADVCQEWEREANLASSKNTRVVNLRLGVVLGQEGGAFAQMIKPFALGVGAKLGSGQQWMSWIHVHDVIEAIQWILKNEAIHGAVNLVAPHPVNNEELTHRLATTLNRPAWFKAPAEVLRLGLGEMSTTLLNSARVLPTQLPSYGFRFAYPTLESALSEMTSEFPNQIFEAFQFIEKPISEVFEFFSDAKNLETITPPWLKFKTLSQSTETIQTDTRIEYRLVVHRIPMRWKTQIHDWKKNKSFIDEQIQGPYSRWYHTHQFESIRGGTLIRDHISYRLPMGSIGNWMLGSFVRKDVSQIFAFRRAKIAEIFKK